MLNRDQIEMIHREIDGANTPDERAAFRSLIETNAEARALEAELRHVARLFDHVGEREPPPHLKQAILAELPQAARATPRTATGWMTSQAMVRWLVSQLKLVTGRMEEAFMTKRTMIYGSVALAIVLVIAGVATGFPPGDGAAGTIGGVEPAARYKGRAMTQADVTLKNPEIQALFQNPEVVRLLRSDVFREATQSAAFRELQASEAYRELLASETYRELMASESYRELLASESFRELQASEAFRDLAAQGAFREALSSEAMRELQANEAYRELLASESYRELLANESYRELLASETYRELMASESYRELLASESFRDLQANAAFRELQANAAFRELQASETFRALSRSQDLSAQFMREAMRVAP